MAVVMSKKQDGVVEKTIIWGTFVLGLAMQLNSFIISVDGFTQKIKTKWPNPYRYENYSFLNF